MTSEAKVKQSDKKRRERGYTLMEILIVLAILALIATFAVPNLMKVFGKAKSDVASLQLDNLKAALDIYRLENGGYPTEEQGLQALVDRPSHAPDSWSGPYIDKPESLIDPWGRPYHYRRTVDGGKIEIYTLGADDAEGGDGENRDISRK